MVQTIQHLTTKHHLGVFIDIDSLIGVYLNLGVGINRKSLIQFKNVT